jgi:hypothetical protein
MYLNFVGCFFPLRRQIRPSSYGRLQAEAVVLRNKLLSDKPIMEKLSSERRGSLNCKKANTRYSNFPASNTLILMKIFLRKKHD